MVTRSPGRPAAWVRADLRHYFREGQTAPVMQITIHLLYGTVNEEIQKMYEANDTEAPLVWISKVGSIIDGEELVGKESRKCAD